MAERWRPVVGWEGKYEVSDRGAVRSLDRVVKRNGYDMKVKGRELKPWPDSRGYLAVTLGKRTARKVHRLVLEAHAGPPQPGQIALHGPGGPADNRWPENLSWGTYTENAADTRRDGHVTWAKLTAEIVGECRDRYRRGLATIEELAAEFRVTPSAMRNAVRGRWWTHVRVPPVTEGEMRYAPRQGKAS